MEVGGKKDENFLLAKTVWYISTVYNINYALLQMCEGQRLVLSLPSPSLLKKHAPPSDHVSPAWVPCLATPWTPTSLLSPGQSCFICRESYHKNTHLLLSLLLQCKVSQLDSQINSQLFAFNSHIRISCMHTTVSYCLSQVSIR